MIHAKHIVLLGLVLPILGACAISKKVEPVKVTDIEAVCIKHNPEVFMDGFEPMLKGLIEAQNISTSVYSETRPQDCRYSVEYVARWRWDLAMYLFYAQIKVLDQTAVVGLAEYDAMMGGANLGKFGTTEEKIAPLVEQLFPQK